MYGSVVRHVKYIHKHTIWFHVHINEDRGVAGVISTRVLLFPVSIEATMNVAQGSRNTTPSEWAAHLDMYTKALKARGVRFDKVRGVIGMVADHVRIESFAISFNVLLLAVETIFSLSLFRRWYVYVCDLLMIPSCSNASQIYM